MNTPLSWVKAYVPELECTAQEYTDAMTFSGTKVEGYEQLDKNLEKIVVARINKIERHPDAEKLVICQVQIDEEGTEFTLVLTPYSMYVIVERDGVELIDLSELKFEEIEKELIDDIKSDLSGWAEFLPSKDEEEIKLHRERIRTKLWMLKELRRD